VSFTDLPTELVYHIAYPFNLPTWYLHSSEKVASMTEGSLSAFATVAGSCEPGALPNFLKNSVDVNIDGQSSLFFRLASRIMLTSEGDGLGNNDSHQMISQRITVHIYLSNDR